jgi:SAM-dependent methyltransferase
VQRGPAPFDRADPADDRAFYAQARKVTHIETGAIDALRRKYAAMLSPGSDVLDLMSSWRSHLPPGLGRVTGLGMNAEEMADNPQLNELVVHDLNADARLPFGDGAFDAVVCAVSVQYLTNPIEVWREARRVLRPGGPAVISFSNRCFPTKAVTLWLSTDDRGHRLIVRRYLEEAGFSTIVDEQLNSPDDPMFVVIGRRELR